MDHWRGIKPKPYNQSKNSGSKPVTPRSKALNTNLSKSSTDKSYEEEVARAVQQLIALNKTGQSSDDKHMSDMSVIDDDDGSDTPVATQEMLTEEKDKCNEVKTPENSVTVESLGYGKKQKKGGQPKSFSKRSLLAANLLEQEKTLT